MTTKDDVAMVVHQYFSALESKIEYLDSEIDLLRDRVLELESAKKAETPVKEKSPSSIPAPSVAGAEVVTTAQIPVPALTLVPASVAVVAPSPVEALLQVPQRSLISANDPMPENLSRLAGDLKSVGVEVNLITLAEWSSTRHDVARAWLDQGAKKDARPDFLPTPQPEKVDLIAALRRSVAAVKPMEKR